MTRGGTRGFVLVGFPDVNGRLRGKALSEAAFEHGVERGLAMTDLMLGVDYADEPIEDFTTLGIKVGAPDLVLRPDLTTLHPVQWRDGWQVCLADAHWSDGRPCELASRQALRHALSELEQEGLAVRAALEYEVRLSDRDGRWLSDGISYGWEQIAGLDFFVERLASGLEGLEVELTAVHTEAGPGLIEVNLGVASGVEAADWAALTKFAVKDVAASFGLKASFLAKTDPGQEGSSGHLHVSCWENDANAMAIGRDSEKLPPVLSAAVAGLLRHMPAASSFFNPTVNSYKRLVPGWFAPVNASWGFDNRSAALRVIRSERPDECRIECRRPGADANPYLVLAAATAAIVSGLRSGAAPPHPVEDDAYVAKGLPALPASLDESLAALASDSALRTLLGEELCRYFETTRRWELKAFQRAVTEWERSRYGEAV